MGIPIETTAQNCKRFLQEAENEDEAEKENNPSHSIRMASLLTNKDGANITETLTLNETLASTETFNLTETLALNETLTSSSTETPSTSEIIIDNVSSNDLKSCLSIIIAQNNALRDENKKLFGELNQQHDKIEQLRST